MNENENLDNHEWIVVFSLIILLGMITFITHKHWFSSYPRPYSDPLYVYSQQIQVHIEGAVQSPGLYLIEKNSTLKDLLIRAQPTAEADLKKLSMSKKIKDGQMIKVPSKEYITVYLEGAVKFPGAKIIPKGSVMEELLASIELIENADLSKIKLKKRLKEGDVLKIPSAKFGSSNRSRKELAQVE